jgi:hypothetical protein
MHSLMPQLVTRLYISTSGLNGVGSTSLTIIVRAYRLRYTVQPLPPPAPTQNIAEAAYHRADKAINQIVELLAAA